MNRKPIAVLLVLCVALSCLCACTWTEPNFPVALSPTDRSALELSPKGREDSELSEIYRFIAKDGNNAADLHKKYPILTLRRDGDTYRVLYEGKTRMLALRFDASGEWIPAHKLCCICPLSKTRGVFDDLSVGDSVKAVQTADPICFFPFLAGVDSEPLESRHYTEDGYYTLITYEKTADDYIVKTVETEIM